MNLVATIAESAKNVYAATYTTPSYVATRDMVVRLRLFMTGWTAGVNGNFVTVRITSGATEYTSESRGGNALTTLLFNTSTTSTLIGSHPFALKNGESLRFGLRSLNAADTAVAYSVEIWEDDTATVANGWTAARAAYLDLISGRAVPGDAMTLTTAYDAAKTAASASGVWANPTRTLTSGGGSGGATAEEIWSYASRTITQVSAVSAGSVVVYTPADSALIRFAYCSLGDLVADLQLNGLADDVLERFIVPATQYILGEIGQFIPTYQQLTLPGNNKSTLIIPPLTTIVAVENDGAALASTDYQLEPNERMWMYGPYVRINCGLESSTIQYWTPQPDAVKLTAAFGLFEQTAKTGTTVGSEQSDSAETLTVADGSKVTPGMVLLICSEMEFVTGTGSPTNVTTLSADCSASDDTLTLTSTANINIGEVLRAGFEKVRVLDKTSTQVHVARGWLGTSRVAHTSGTAVDVYRTYNVERAVNGTSAGGHLTGAEIKRYKVPDDVNYLARQIAALMLKKSQTGFVGRSGNQESGESYYIFEFPREAIERVKRNYYIPAGR